MMYIHDLPGEIGVITHVSLRALPQLRKKNRLHIVALGDVGMTMLLGLRLLGGDVLEYCGIYDINEKNSERLEMEMNQISYPGGEGGLPPVKIVAEADLFDCDVFVFCAAKGVPALDTVGDVRMAQLAANRELVRHFAAMAAKAAYKGLICIVSDPVDPLCKVFLQTSGLQAVQVQGYGLGVMNGRARYYAERNPEFKQYLTEGRVFGPHGEDLVVANSVAHYDDDVSRRLTDLVVHANLAVRGLGYKPYIAPALSSAALSVLLTLRGDRHYSSLWFGNAEKGAFLGLCNRFTPDGAEYEDPPLPDALYERIRTAYVRLCELS